MNKNEVELLQIISNGLFSNKVGVVSDSLLHLAANQEVLPLISNGNTALLIISNNIKVLNEQDIIRSLLNGIPYAVICEPAASIYYPNPLKKTLRNIEIITKKPAAVYNALLQGDYVPSCSLGDNVASIYFVKNGIAVILRLDLNDFIIDGIDNAITQMINGHSLEMLSDEDNGLLLINEVSRNPRLCSVIDWVMYINHYLHDDQWESFKRKSDRLELTDLAKTAGRFGQIYLGLSNNFQWCLDVPGKQVEKLATNVFRNNVDITPAQRRRPFLHYLYNSIANSPLWKPAYYLNDLSYIIQYKLMGEKRISESDRINVEKNVTFIYKSFNRQRQARRLYMSIKKYYPEAKIIIADDSFVPLENEGVIHLPFNSGLSKGLIKALELVKTPYVMRLDDDMLLTPNSNIHNELKFLQNHPEVDLVSIQANYQKPVESANRFSIMRMEKNLLIPAGTIIDGREVVYKASNIFLAKTEKVKMIGYDSNIQILDHHDFFYRAAGKIVCVQDPNASLMHCHNRFDRMYNKYRFDIKHDEEYLKQKDKKHE